VRLIKENNKLTINYTVPNKLEKITLGFEKNIQTLFTWDVIIQSCGKHFGEQHNHNQLHNSNKIQKITLGLPIKHDQEALNSSPFLSLLPCPIRWALSPTNNSHTKCSQILSPWTLRSPVGSKHFKQLIHKKNLSHQEFTFQYHTSSTA